MIPLGGGPFTFSHFSECPHLVHGVLSKKKVDSALFWEPGRPVTNTFVTADAVVTNVPHLALVIQVADCQAVMLADLHKHVIANVHAGWRGSVQNIIGKCVGAMIHHFGCNPLHILTGICSSLGPCCAEFVHYRREIPEPLWRYKLPGQNYFDFWTMSFDQLRAKGLKPDHIRNMNQCTRCRTGRFFSYREAKKTGRFACVIGLV